MSEKENILPRQLDTVEFVLDSPFRFISVRADE